ncbi:membrane protein insertase YidC [Candidatus Saccharibacteria bacterium]|nr:membrane protein insertase YidC [Candidatus Saccharibacteria bacterium]
MFTTFIAQPIFNLLVFIYAILPGHNFGVAIVIFTIIVRLALWPLVKKQLHQTKLMRKMQPELKRIKKEAKGDRRKESELTMELYRERGINPFGSIGILLLQLPILIALYSGLNRIVQDPNQLVTFAYPFLQNLSWMQHLASNIHAFDSTFLGIVELTKPALSQAGVYWPAMTIVLASVVVQYYQGKQLLPQDKDARKLRVILKEAGEGKQADQSEINAAIGRSTRYLLPAMIFLFTVHLASALSLYWLVGGIVAFIQQSIVLREDEEELEALAAEPSKDTSKIPEAEIVSESPKKKKTKTTSKKAKRKRRK